MKKYIYISFGGIAGAILRYLIRSISVDRYPGDIPFNTLVINLSGCFLLAFVLTGAKDVLKINADLKLGIATGFAGAYTTFSTLCKEVVTLIAGKHYVSAGLYVILSVMLGIGCVYTGIKLAEKAAGRWNKIKKDTEFDSVSKRR
jgi:CrcB protein